MSALAAAASLGHTQLVRLLLDRGAAVDAKPTTAIPMFRFTGHGLTALHAAVYAGQPQAAELLLSHGGADISATFDAYRAVGSPPEPGSPGRRDRRTWTTGVTALHLADDSPGCAALLLRRGADAAARDGWGRTPLHWAMGSGNVDVVRLLLAAGTPVDVLDDDGATPLAVLVARLESGAGRAGHPDIVRMLLAAGANPDLRYPQDLSVKARLLLMEEWRGVYGPIFEECQLGSPGFGGRRLS
jgi:ankyrin repeat protein